METISVSQIAVPSRDYDSSLSLRDKMLFKPLGRNLFKEDLSEEKDLLHIVAHIGGELAGAMVLARESAHSLRVTQLAVDILHQGKGAGTKMVEYAERLASAGGYRSISLDARSTAVEFLSDCGYRKIGQEHIDIGIPHTPMKKYLTSPVNGSCAPVYAAMAQSM